MIDEIVNTYHRLFLCFGFMKYKMPESEDCDLPPKTSLSEKTLSKSKREELH